MDSGLYEKVILERVELIARLTSEGLCRDKDREIALNLIAEIARDTVLKNDEFLMIFPTSSHLRRRYK